MFMTRTSPVFMTRGLVILFAYCIKELCSIKRDRRGNVAQETSTRVELNQRKMTGSDLAAAPIAIRTFSSATGNVASMANIETTSIAMNTNQAPL
jgi:hypothetical protein